MSRTLVARALFVFGVLVALTSIAGVVLNYSPVPFWDQWDGTLGWYMRAEKDWWPAFWSLHNEHRLLFSRLIFWADMRWFGGVNILSLCANVVVCALLALAVYRAAIRGSGITREAKLATAGLTLALCFSWMQGYNFTWGFQNQWFAVNLFALLAFHALALGAEQGHDVRWFCAALLAALASCFSMANGNVVWLMLFVLALYYRFPLRYLAAIAITAIVELFAYFWHATNATGSLTHESPVAMIRHQAIDLLHYATLYLGSPLWYAFDNHARLADAAGALVFLGTFAGVWTALWRRDLKAMPLLAFAVFLCATAFATAIGRLVQGMDSVFVPRYATGALLAWIALLLFWAYNSSRSVTRASVYACIAVALAAVLTTQRASLRPDYEDNFNRLVAGQAIREGVYEHRYLAELWGADDALRKIAEAARTQGLSILASSPMGYDDARGVVIPTGHCAGWLDGSEPTGTNGVNRASGWVYRKWLEPSTVVVTDANWTVIGAGVVGGYRPDVAAALKTHNFHTGWVAFYSGAIGHVLARTRMGNYCVIR